MKDTFKLKPVYLERLIWRLVIVGAIISLLVFLALNIDLSFKLSLSMLIVFIGVLIVFYLNKYEPEIITVEDKNFEFSYFNKVFFKRRKCVYAKNEIEVKIGDNIILVSVNGRLIGRIRKKSMEPEDWGQIISHLQN